MSLSKNVSQKSGVKQVQISMQQPLNTVQHGASDQFDDAQFGNKPVQRALCRVIVGKSQNAFVWLEKSLDKFAIATHSGKGIIIVDNSAMARLQRYASGNSTLYQRLVDREVTFVAAKTVMKFVRKKYHDNPLPELMSNLRKIPFAKKGETGLKDFLRASVLKLLCPDYAFSHDQQLQRIGVVDADSLVPIRPSSTASDSKSEAPMSLCFSLLIDTRDGCNFSMPALAYTDSEFVLTTLKNTPLSLHQPLIIDQIRFFSNTHNSFFELGSAKLAEELTGRVIKIADNLQQLPWLAKSNDNFLVKGGSLYWVADGLRHLFNELHISTDQICFTYCLDIKQSVAENCPSIQVCSADLYNLQGIVSVLLYNSLLSLSLESLIRDIDKLSLSTGIHFCCNSNAKRATADICRNALDHNECVQVASNSKTMSLIHLLGRGDDVDSNYGVLLPRADIDTLLPSFSSPLMDWGFHSSVSDFRLSDQVLKPKVVMALGKEHADILLGNVSAFFQLDASWSLQCPQKTSHPQSPALLDQPITGFKYGVVTGLADELFSFTPLPTQYNWLYNSGRGFFFGGNIGLTLSLGENIYRDVIEPALPDGLLKACLRPVASNALLAAALLQGQTLSVAASVAGYTATRIVGKMARYVWERTNTRQ